MHLKTKGNQQVKKMKIRVECRWCRRTTFKLWKLKNGDVSVICEHCQSKLGEIPKDKIKHSHYENDKGLSSGKK